MIVVALAFTVGVLLGWQLGRRTERYFAKAIGKRKDALVEGVYRVPAPRPALHLEQEAFGPAPAIQLSLTAQCRLIHESVRSR